ncbi:hypothetical protein ACTHAM_003066 [Cellulomonas soli]|uniref:hypothetical protein n=1 Tax=Cellulomonas soli TaxID=931535 RepID=UPI003F87E9BB
MRCAVAWLLHPVTCVALVLLLVNDHLLKGRVGTWWTGKASDVAWLVVVPPLLAVALTALAAAARRQHDDPRRASQGWATVSLASTGIVFVLVKSTQVAADAASAVLTAVAGPSLVLADPTDLLMVPALAVAWGVARATMTGERPSRRPRVPSTMRWLVVLPVAVLATAATSQVLPEGTRDVTVVDGVVLVQDDAWYSSADGTHWSPFDGTPPAERADWGTPACVPRALRTCFRPIEVGMGVERSDDGGRTWQVDWAVVGEQLAALESRYEQDGASLWTSAVAVQHTADGFRVYAADNDDGLAVRDEQGEWTRLGFTYQPGGAAAVPLPGESTAIDHPLPPGVPLGLLAMLAVIVLSRPGAAQAPRTPAERTGRGAAVLGGLFALAAAAANSAWGVVHGQEIGVDLILGGTLVPYVVVGALCLVSAVLAICAATILCDPAAGWTAVATGLGVALVVELVTPTVLAVVVAVAVLAAGIGGARQAARRSSRPPGQPARPAAIDGQG